MVAGSKIWVEDIQLAWIAADVISVENEKVTARAEKSKKLVRNHILFLYMATYMFCNNCLS